MIEIQITTTPINLGAALGAAATARVTTLYRIQNRGPATVYRSRAAIAVNPAAVRGFRHGVGSVVMTAIPSDDIRQNGVLGPTWVWTAAGDATLIAEEAY